MFPITSDEKTSISSLLNYVNSDLYTIGNISKTVVLQVPQTETMINGYIQPNQWEVVTQYLPMEFFSLLESYRETHDIYRLEKFDSAKYACNPKRYAYDKYGLTNMWRPIMILNKCPSIVDFDFDLIKYYDTTVFNKVMSVLISRMQHSEALSS